MSTLRHNRRILSFCFVFLAMLMATIPLKAQSITETMLAQVASPAAQASYPSDPPSNIAWSATRIGWSDMVTAFNNARERENALLNLTMPTLDFPPAAAWEAMSDGEKALWLINEERTARGLAPLHGLEANVNAVAQDYADWLMVNNAFAHDADGLSPWERLDANPAIGACHDFLGISENLYFLASTSPNVLPLMLEQALYRMLYEDEGSSWGHRHAMLWVPYTENSDAPDREGFLGIGHAQGGYTLTDSGSYFPNTHIVVMNFFDPCATWTDGATSTPTATPTPVASVTPIPSFKGTPTPVVSATPRPAQTPTPSSQTRAVSGKVRVAQVANVPGLAGVTIANEDGHTTQTSAEGDFMLVGLSPSKHILTPSKAGYVFAPPSIEVDLSDGDLSGILITAIAGPSGAELSFSVHLPFILPKR